MPSREIGKAIFFSWHTMYNKNLHRYSIVVACSTLLLLAAGGMVTSTDSGLAVPDWPLSYGQLMPPMVGGIFYEHGHRMIASGVGLLTLILAFWAYKREPRTWTRVIAYGALVAVIVQGLLGGLTVLWLLPTWVSSTHATLAQIFFCTVSLFALVTSRWWMEDSSAGGKTPSTGSVLLSAVLTGGIALQLVLGAVMRHSHAGLVVPDFPFAFGSAFPSLSADALKGYEESLIQRDFWLAADGPLTAFQVTINLLHRYWGFVLVATGVTLSVRLIRDRAAAIAVRRVGRLIPLLLLLQGTLGYWTIVSRKDPVIATLHQTNGAITLVTLVLLTAVLFRFRSKSSAAQA